MNDFQNSLLETMQMFSNNAAMKASNSPVIKGEIIEIIDAGLKTYKVRYLENEFSAISTGNTKYAIGEIVYILVPDGDFSNNKIILGSTSPSASATLYSGNSLNYYDISENFFNNSELYQVNSYKTELKSITLDKIQSEVLAEYLQNYKTLAFGYKVKTALKETQVGGNYGMRINIPAAVEVDGVIEYSIKTYTLDIDNILGTPYRIEDWSPQSIYFTLEDRYMIDTTKPITIDYFCSDFPENLNINENDIFFKDIFFKVVEEYTEEDNTGYKLVLISDSGNYFLKQNNASAKKIITPKLKVNGEETSFKGKPCYWFIEDSSIEPGHEKYVSHGGRGWKLIQEGGETLTVDISQVAFDANFKCVILYDEYVISETIYLKNLKSEIKIDVYPTYGSTVFIRNAGEVDLSALFYEKNYTDINSNLTNVIFHWERYDKTHTLISSLETYSSITEINAEKCFVTNLKFLANTVENFNYVKCEITKEGTLIGSRELIISVTDNLQYKLAIENGNKIYKYDSDGDSPMIAQYDGPSSSALAAIQPLNYKIIKVDGRELTEDEYRQCKYTWYVPVNSMFILEDIDKEILSEDGEYYIITGKGHRQLNYQIAKKFDKSKAENNIRLEVDFLGKLLDNIINISFLKEGASGTNGTKYAAMIVMEDENGNKYPYGTRGGENGYVQKLHFVYSTASKKWNWHDTRDNKLEAFANRMGIGILVYEDGELLKFTSDKNTTDYEVSYSIFDEKTTNPCFSISTTSNGKANITTKGTPTLDGEYCNIIQAKVTIRKSGNDSLAAAETVLYAYYPIEITITNINDTTVLPTFDGGFSEVLYASDGTNPQYDTTYPFSCSESILEESIRDYYAFEWSAQHHLHQYKIDEAANGVIRFKPSQKYDDGNSKNFVKAKLSFNKEQELKTLKENNNNRIEYLRSIIFDKDDIHSSVVNAESMYLDYDFNAKIKLVKPLLEARREAHKQVCVVDEYLIKLEEYINTYHPDVFTYCEEFDKEVRGYTDKSGKHIKGLQDYVIDAKNMLASFPSYDSLIDLSLYSINFKPLQDSFCLYQLNRGVATALDAYIVDVNNAIIAYKELLDKVKTFSTFNTYKEIIYKLSAICNDINDLVSIKSLLREQYVNVLYKVVEVTEFSNLVKGFYSEQIFPYLATDKTSQEVELWQKEIDKLTAENDKADLILATKGKVLVHIRPIVLTFNRYEMSNINEWDGNKLETGANNEYLLAPQVGAGYKESDNSFTGVVMGMRNIYGNTNKDNVDVGLFGYSKGRQSYFLDAREGTATFGIPGQGQIIIDPDNNEGDAVIYGGNYVEGSSGSGMKLNLTKPSIAWGNGNFTVDEDGYAHIGGGGDGDIGGWNIYDNRLESADKKVILHSKDKYIKFADADGKLYSGSHSTLAGTQNGFYLSHDGLSIGSTIRISSGDNGEVKVGRVNGSKCWTIGGDTVNSYIGYSTTEFKSTDLGDTDKHSIGGNSGDVYIGTDGIRLGNKFAVDNNGNLVAKHLITTGGTIGGWTIDSSSISSSGITLDKNGTIKGTNGTDTWMIKGDGSASFNKIDITGGGINLGSGVFKVTNKGAVTASNVDITGGKLTIGDDFEVTNDGQLNAFNGKIGGWSIGQTTLSAGEVTFNSDGNLSGKNWYINNDGSAKFGNFSVSNTGAISASGGTFTGITINGSSTFNGSGTFSGTVVATGGTIGGAQIVDGKLQVTSAYISGKLEASQIKVGDIVIEGDQINSTVPVAYIPNLNANKITAGTLDADRIGAGSITAGKIASNAITADKIEAGAITSGKIASSAITSGKIAAGAITADKIAAEAITADKLKVTDLSATGATISGWNIGTSEIYKTSGYYKVALNNTFTGGSDNIPCFYTKNTQNSSYNCAIYASGSGTFSSLKTSGLWVGNESLSERMLKEIKEYCGIE